MGMCYMGGFIGYDKYKYEWLKYRTSTWEKKFAVTEKSGKYTQESYSAVVHAIQLEWIFLQCMTKDMGYAFAEVEKII